MQVDRIKVTFTVNEALRFVEVESRETLLDALRDKLELVGAKKACDEAVCGACTVIFNGKAICSCMILAVEASGSQIVTIEGLKKEDLDDMQKAFIQNDAAQCGFCTSGQILSAKAFLSALNKKNAPPDEEMIKEALSGNLCRCGCYNNIVRAVQQVSRMRVI
ncbi:MAG: (2Fe-2S)-binding protein [Nitrososphaerales archaeon]